MAVAVAVAEAVQAAAQALVRLAAVYDQPYLEENMKIPKTPRGIIALLSLAACIASGNDAQALTAGHTYTIAIKKFNADGSVAAQASTSTTAVADINGKISFSLTGIPDSSSCNFMLVTATDILGGPVAREAIVPCPATGATLPLGVSPVTAGQTEALKAAFLAAGSDDPIMAVFGMVIVRTPGITAPELTAIGTIIQSAINSPGGFVDYLVTTRGVTGAQIAVYRSSIVSQLAETSAGYSKLIKDSVTDGVGANDDPQKRGEAASVLLGTLVKAATAAGFPQDYVMEAFDAMGSVAVPLLVGDPTLSADHKQAIDSSVGGGLHKLKANRAIEKYSTALSTLGGSIGDVGQFQIAAATLDTAMRDAYKTFEAASYATGSENAAVIAAAETTLRTAMDTAFSTFMGPAPGGISVSNARLTTMITNINTALGVATGLTPANFQFYKQDGSHSNWPVNMVVLTDWVSGVVGHGGSMTYVRDNAPIPPAITWSGECSDLGGGDKNACIGRGQVWTPKRTCFGVIPAVGEANIALCHGMPTSYANLFAIQEDIMIREFAREAAMQAGGGDMTAERNAEKTFTDALRATIAGNLGGTTNGATAISGAQKAAIVTLMQSPRL